MDRIWLGGVQICVKRIMAERPPPEYAFRVFTDQIGAWWPLQQACTHGGDRTAEIHLEGRPGGGFYERFTDGEEYRAGALRK